MTVCHEKKVFHHKTPLFYIKRPKKNEILDEKDYLCHELCKTKNVTLMNDENTLQFDNLSNDGQKMKGNGNLWKKVIFGTTTGILLGAIGIRAVDHLNGSLNEEENVENTNTDADTGGEVPVYNDAPMAHVNNGMSFDEAFSAARAEVGPGGVFVWHGGIYGTYYETEWDAMSDDQKTEYAQSVHPPVIPEHIQVNVINEIHPEVVVDAREVEVPDNQSHIASRTTIDISETYPTEDEDVHIVGQGSVQGHDAVAFDMTGNYEADVVIIDVDDTHSLTDPDVVVFRGGMATTIGDMDEGNPPVSLIGDEHQAGMENPGVAPGMPDYMDDAAIPT